MNKELYNRSGCKDPTPYQAIRNVEKKKYYPLVYICSPFSGDVENNVIKARTYSRYALDKGNIPIAPHLLFPQFMSDESERRLAMHFNYVLLGKWTADIYQGIVSLLCIFNCLIRSGVLAPTPVV